MYILFSCKQEVPPRTAAASATPTPTIVRPGSLPLHLGYDSINPTQPSPTSVITRTPPSNRLRYATHYHLISIYYLFINMLILSLSSSPSASFPMMMQLPNGQTVPLLPSPGQTSVISVRHSLPLFHKHTHVYTLRFFWPTCVC